VARRYADRGRHDIVDGDGARSPAGLPLVPGALASIDVRREAVHPGGDHSIVTGIVEWSETREGQPLCYFRSAFFSRPAP
jgi:3-hydroxy-9,10-secoandrosta-1,3,5(10)-triene-9,17-dione monooxygenase reductase component